MFSQKAKMSRLLCSKNMYKNRRKTYFDTLCSIGQTNEKPSVHAGFRRFFDDYSTKALIWDELLFLFFVSITLFVETMSRISNCFNF